jgi:hypothetical protein
VQCAHSNRIRDQRFSGVIAPKTTQNALRTANTQSKQGGPFLLLAKNDERFLPTFAVEAQSAHILTDTAPAFNKTTIPVCVFKWVSHTLLKIGIKVV